MNKTIITTVGTSLISNWKETNRYGLTDEIRERLKELEKCSFFENSGTTADGYINYVKGGYGESGILELLTTFLNANSNCAEISSITAIENELRKSLKESEELTLTIHLLCTDTILSPLCAEVITRYLKGKGYNVNFEQVSENETVISKIKEQGFSSDYIIKDLRVDSKEKFEESGFHSLIKQVKEVAKKQDCILNITGGYKALIPVLTIIAQLEELEINYLYQDEKSELLEIPALPIGFDWIKAELYAHLLNGDALNTYDTNSDEFKELIRLKLVENVKGKIKPTFFGGLLKSYFEQKMPDSPSYLGDFAEYKIFEHFINFPYQTRYSKVQKGVKHYLNKNGTDVYENKPSELPQADYEEVEFDLVLVDVCTQDYVIVESKFYKQVNDLSDKIKKRIYTMKKLYKEKVACEYVLYIPKLSTQNIETQNLKKLFQKFHIECQKEGVSFKIFYTDIEVDIKKVKINFGSFIKDRFEMGKDRHIKPFLFEINENPVNPEILS